VSQLTFGVHHMAGGWAVLDPGHPAAQPEQPQGRCYFGPIANHERDTLAYTSSRNTSHPGFTPPGLSPPGWATFAVA
jgi:hypothetical protein